MKKIILSAAKWQNPADAHRALKEALSFPEYYGMNLDALHDCLPGLTDTALTVTGCAFPKQSMPEKWRVFEHVFLDSAGENPGFTVELMDGEPERKQKTDYRGILLSRYQTRKTRAQKDAFIAFVKDEAKKLGWDCKAEKGANRFKSRNIAVGDPEKAKVVFTAHYDTQPECLFPNLVFPMSRLKTLLAQTPMILLMVGVSLGLGALLRAWTGANIAMPIVFLIVYFGLFALVFFGPANRHTANDNTSGTAALLTLMEALPTEQRGDAAFLFFDNEEQGKLGSKRYFKMHEAAMKDKLIVNYDCIGDGDHILFVQPKEPLAGLEDMLRRAFPARDGMIPVFTDAKKARYNSDQMSFPRGVGVAALHEGRFGLYLPRIHTRRDTVCEQKNLDYVVACSQNLLHE